MSFMSVVPNEVWCLIIQGVPRLTIYQCIRVNKTWMKIATPLFYDSIILSGDAVLRLRSRIKNANDFDSLMTLKRNCSFVKKLVIRDEPYMLDIMSTLFVFLFLNLQSIDFSRSYFRQKYMDFFIQSPDSTCLQYIEEILPPNESSVDQVYSYYDLCRKYKKTLIKYPIDSISFDHSSTISNILPNFAKLTHLFIQNNQDKDCDIFSLINFCPNLIAFEFSTDNIMDYNLAFALHNLHHNLNIKGSMLQVLDLQFPKMTAAYFEFFTICLSAYRRLQIFNLHLTKQTIYELIQCNNIETLLKYASILQPIDNLDLQMSASKEATDDILPAPTRDLRIAFLDKYWAFINCMKGDKWLDCLTSLSPKRIPYQQIDHTVICEKNRLYISNIEHQYWDYLGDVQQNLKTTSVSGEGTKNIDCLYFNNVPVSKAVDVLNFSLLHCPRLAQLSIVTRLNSISFSIGGVNYYGKGSDKRYAAVGDQIINKANICNCSEELTRGILDAINTHLPGIYEIEIRDFHSKSYEQVLDLTGVMCLDNLIINNTTPFNDSQPWRLVIGIDDGLSYVKYYASQILKCNPRLNNELFKFGPIVMHHLETILCDDRVLKQEMIIKCQKLNKITFKMNEEAYEVLNINSY